MRLLAVLLSMVFASFPSNAQLKPDADIVGVRLGMTMNEAEKIVREHMKVALVTVSGAKTSGRRSMPTPLREKRSFHDAVYNGEAISLVNGEDGGENVLAVFRRFPITKGMTKESIVAALVEKYGKYDEADEKPGSSVYHWNNGKPQACLFFGTDSQGSGKVVEGILDKKGGNSYSPQPQLRMEEASSKEDVERIGPFLRQCGPTVTAHVWYRALFVYLYDVSLFAPIYERYKPDTKRSPRGR